MSAARADFNIALMCAEEIGNYDLIDLINQELDLETEVRAIPVNTEGEEAAPANFVSVTPLGGRIAVNGSITVTFDNAPADVTANAGTVTVAGKTATITGPFIPGPLALTITWADGAQALNYIVTAPDTDPPAVTGGTVKDGDKDVDPEAINSDAKIEIEFNEDVSGNVALQTEGGDDVGWLGKVEGNKATLELVKGKEIDNETTYVIAGKVSDAAGNSTDVSVTFVTKGVAGGTIGKTYWNRTVSGDPGRAANQELSETEQRHIRYWTGLREYMVKKGSSVNCPSPGTGHYLDLRLERTGFRHRDAIDKFSQRNWYLALHTSR